MFTIYVLKSEKDGTRYVGMTGTTPEIRLKQHNQGKHRYIKGRRPWYIIYDENCHTKSDALKREKFLKSRQGRKFLDDI